MIICKVDYKGYWELKDYISISELTSLTFSISTIGFLDSEVCKEDC